MRLKAELMIHKVSDETVVVPTGKLSIQFQGIKLSEIMRQPVSLWNC